MSLWNYNKAVEYLNDISQYTSGTGVERAEKLLKALGNPEEQLKIVHVAGTNGKGSVCAYMSSVMTVCGYKTGLFTSPHLIDIRERIQIDGKLVSEQDFLNAFIKVYNAYLGIAKEDPAFKLAYFDYLLGMSLCIFKEQAVDFVVMETGLGGRLDATNAVERPILSIINTISLEHTAILGSTITEIAQEKAGIIKPEIPVVYCRDHADSARVFEKVFSAQNHQYVDVRKKCKLAAVCRKDYEILKNTGKVIDFSIHNEYYKNDCFSITSPAQYQVMNATIALTAIAVLKDFYKIHFPIEQMKDGIKEMYWPGRMELVKSGVYVDGAHNPQGIACFIETVNELCSGVLKEKESALLFSVVNDKNYEEMIHILGMCTHFKQVLVTQIKGKRQLSKKQIAQCFANSGVQVMEFDNLTDALEYGLKNCRGQLFCTGSLYLAGDIRRFLNMGNYKMQNMEASGK